MKKIVTRRSVMGSMIAGFIIFIVYTLSVYAAMKRGLRIRLENDAYADALFCVSDMLERSFNMSRLFLMIVFVCILILVLKPYFRNMVLIQYKSRAAILLEMYRYCVGIAFVLSLGAAIISTILAAILSDSYSNNWQTKGSFMYIYCGVPEKPYILSTWENILIYIISLFFILLIAGVVVICFWYLFNPVVGVVGMVALYIMEMAQTPPVFKLLFSYINIVNVTIYHHGIDFQPFFICMLLWCIVFITSNIWIIRKKNLFY